MTLVLVLGGLVVLGVAVLPGLLLWWPERADPLARADLGVNLIAGALVALAVLLLQVVVEDRLRRIEDRRSAQARQDDLLLRVGLQSNLTGVRLVGKDLHEAYLYGKTLRRAELQGVHLEHARLSRARLYRADLSDAHMHFAILDGVRAQEPRDIPPEFPTVSFAGADLRDANLFAAQLSGANFDGARLQRAKFTRAILNQAIFTNARLELAEFTEANLDGADFRKADLTTTDLSVVARAAGAKFAGAKYDRQTKWPTRMRRKPRRCEPFATCHVRGSR